eukprot:GHVU01141814.1.p1 GENE.GHVU01141814.1~~GHVU01141814.1.p1  ORF type:complete len:454 (+),score=16.85 GHVU01141814.1:656-2017(+)
MTFTTVETVSARRVIKVSPSVGQAMSRRPFVDANTSVCASAFVRLCVNALQAMAHLPQSWRTFIGASAGAASGTTPNRHRAALAPPLGLPVEAPTRSRRGPSSTPRRLHGQLQGFTTAFDEARGRTPVASVAPTTGAVTAHARRQIRPPPVAHGGGGHPNTPAGNLVNRLLDEFLEEEEEQWRVDGDLLGEGGVPLHNTQALSPSYVHAEIRREELDPDVSPGRLQAALSSRRGHHTPPSTRSSRVVPLPSPPTTAVLLSSSAAVAGSSAHPCTRPLPHGAGLVTTRRDVADCYQSKTLETRTKACFCLHSAHFRQVANTLYPTQHAFDARRGALSGRDVAATARKLVCAVFNVNRNTLNSWVTQPRLIATWLASTELLTLGQAVGGVREVWSEKFAYWSDAQKQERVLRYSGRLTHSFTNSHNNSFIPHLPHLFTRSLHHSPSVALIDSFDH